MFAGAQAHAAAEHEENGERRHIKDGELPDDATENVGTADEFRVCAQGSAVDAVVYVGATRSQVAIPATTCSTNFTIPDDGDFTVAGMRAQVFGVYSGNSEDAYLLHGFEPG